MDEDDDGLCGRVAAFGAAGMGREEIAAGLGMSVEEVAGREAADAGFAEAMGRAEAAARAWWAALRREALAAGVRLSGAVWREALGGGPDRGGAAGAGAALKPRETAIFEIPDNGRTRRPDGTADCDHPDWCYRHDLALARDEVDDLEAELARLGSNLEIARERLAEIEEGGIDAYVD